MIFKVRDCCVLFTTGIPCHFLLMIYFLFDLCSIFCVNIFIFTGSFPVRFVKRLISQAFQLQKIFELTTERLMAGLKTGTFFQKERLERDYFNTQKLIVAISETGKVGSSCI